MDFDEDVLGVTPPPEQSTGLATQSWHGYPQSAFPNWTESQVKRCGMLTECPVGESDIFKVDVFHDSTFGEESSKMFTIKDSQTQAAFWDWLKSPVSPLVSYFRPHRKKYDGVVEGGEYSRTSPFCQKYDQRSSANVGDEVSASFL